MGVLEARNQEPPGEVDGLGGRAGETANVIAADGGNATALNGHRRRPR